MVMKYVTCDIESMRKLFFLFNEQIQINDLMTFFDSYNDWIDKLTDKKIIVKCTDSLFKKVF